jgi:hypothetical protein
MRFLLQNHAERSRYARRFVPTDRTTLRLSDERRRLRYQAGEIVAPDPLDDPPMSDVIDAALTHLVESDENLQKSATAIGRKR